MSVIALSHITKDYGGGHGVFDVSFAVEQGEVFGFLGPNGAGKTTTIRQLMGFLAPDSGTCTINGLDCRTQTAAIQKNMGYSLVPYLENTPFNAAEPNTVIIPLKEKVFIHHILLVNPRLLHTQFYTRIQNLLLKQYKYMHPIY